MAYVILHGEIGFDVWEDDRPLILGLATRGDARRAIKKIREKELLHDFVQTAITNLRSTLREEGVSDEDIVAMIRAEVL